MPRKLGRPTWNSEIRDFQLHAANRSIADLATFLQRRDEPDVRKNVICVKTEVTQTKRRY